MLGIACKEFEIFESQSSVQDMHGLQSSLAFKSLLEQEGPGGEMSVRKIDLCFLVLPSSLPKALISYAQTFGEFTDENIIQRQNAFHVIWQSLKFLYYSQKIAYLPWESARKP